MLGFVCKRLTQLSTGNLTKANSVHLHHLHTVQFLSSSISNPIKDQEKSLTTSYLIDACGLSLKEATLAAKSVTIRKTQKPDSALELFFSNGFTKSQVAKLIYDHPRLILAHPDKTLRPKIEYFKSLGIIGSDLTKILSADILRYSLKNQIRPLMEFLIDFVETKENLIHALKQSNRVVCGSLSKAMKPNVSTLRAYGVPDYQISKLMILHPYSLMFRANTFKEVVKEIKEMGFLSTSRSFILAVRTMATISRENWGKKKELLKSFGWSDIEFVSAFRVQPAIMLCSEKKIREMNDFLVNNAGLKPSDIARCPNLFLTSLEKRIVPRCSVLRILLEKGLVRRDLNVIWVLNNTKKDFERKFVTDFGKDYPEVIEAYQGNITI